MTQQTSRQILQDALEDVARKAFRAGLTVSVSLNPDVVPTAHEIERLQAAEDAAVARILSARLTQDQTTEAAGVMAAIDGSVDDDAATPEVERRITRLATPSCPACGTANEVAVASRTHDVVYFRCLKCGWVQSLWKPFHHLPG